jgi:hypothetical protein
MLSAEHRVGWGQKRSTLNGQRAMEDKELTAALYAEALAEVEPRMID